MTKGTPTPSIYVYKEINVGKYKTTRHFEIVEEKTINGSGNVSKKLNISVDQQCALTSPVFWLKVSEGRKWSKDCLTGLYETQKPNIYHGDANKKKHLMLFVFSENKSVLTVYFYRNYYTSRFYGLEPFKTV